MMRRLWLARVLLAALTLSAVCVQAQEREPRESIEADVSSRSVSITSSFVGSELVIFGTVENSRQPSAESGIYDVVVVVEGTPAPVVVRKKSNVGGLWVNTQMIRFASFPSYYAIASTRPIDEIAEEAVLDKNEIGFGHVRMVPAGGTRTTAIAAEDAKEFREAVIRLKQREKLYVTADYGVTFIGRSLFRSTLSLPPNVPVGPLVARVYLLREGKLLAQHRSQVVLERKGIERFLHQRAYRSPFLYGLATVLLAAAAGLAAAFAFQRSVNT